MAAAHPWTCAAWLQVACQWLEPPQQPHRHEGCQMLARLHLSLLCVYWCALRGRCSLQASSYGACCLDPVAQHVLEHHRSVYEAAATACLHRDADGKHRGPERVAAAGLLGNGCTLA